MLIIILVCVFMNQMIWLCDQGYIMLILYQLEGYVCNKINFLVWVVVIIFDDGLKLVNCYVYLVLKQYGFYVIVFIIFLCIKCYLQKWDLKFLQFMSIFELCQIQDVFDIQLYIYFLYWVDVGWWLILFSCNYYNILFDFVCLCWVLSQFNLYVFYFFYFFGGYNVMVVQVVNDVGFYMVVMMVCGKVKLGDNLFLLKWLYILCMDLLEMMLWLISNQLQG